jgi:hypothetical protein
MDNGVPLSWGDIVLAVEAYKKLHWPDRDIESIHLPRGDEPGYILFYAQKSADAGAAEKATKDG